MHAYCQSLWGLVIAAILIMAAVPAQANDKYASLVMDAETGLIISQRYPDKRVYPASLTKIMTLMMVFDALETGRLRLNDNVYISRHAAGMPPSKLNLPVGSTIKVEDAILALVTKSANDVAAALGEKISGSESQFGVDMTRRAKQIGMTHTVFRNASGLPDRAQYTTARDMATLGRYMIYHYPRYYKYFSTRNFSYRGASYRNHNRLLESYNGMDGIKTGYINDSGFNLMASAVKNNRRLIGVVFGGRSTQTRNAHMVELLDSGFDKINTISIAIAEPPVPGRKPLTNVIAQTTTTTRIVRAEEAQRLTELAGQGDSDPTQYNRYETGLMAAEAYKNTQNAPVQGGQIVTASYAPAEGQLGTLAVQPVAAHANQRFIKPPMPASGNWSIQIGAYNSRIQSEKMLTEARRKLPRDLAHAAPLVAPLQSGDKWLFRARMAGLTQNEAQAACNYFNDCLTIAPAR